MNAEYITNLKIKSPQECPATGVVLIAFGTKSNLNIRIQKALEEKGIDHKPIKVYEEEIQICFPQQAIIICPFWIPPEGRDPSLDVHHFFFL